MTYEDLSLLRGLPAAPHAEAMLIAACLLDAEVILTIEGMDAEDLTDPRNRIIFIAILDLHRSGQKIDRITIAEHLQKTGALEQAGGIGYLVDLDASGLNGSGMAPEWARTIQDRAAERRGILACHQAIRHALERGNGASGLFTELSRITSAIEQAISRHVEIPNIAQIVEREGAARIFGTGDGQLRTPWKALNSLIGGFERQQMVTVGARPSVGKSVILTQIAEYNAAQGANVLLFTLEMGRRDIICRLISAATGIENSRVRRPAKLTAEERKRCQEALYQLQIERTTLRIEDHSFTIAAIRSKLAQSAANFKIDLVVIDYLQLIFGVGRSRVEEITEISRSLKQLAEQFDCTVLVASQLSREIEKEGREPRLSDLRDSGSIEQDSDIVIFPHRRPNQPPESNYVDSDLIIAKQRNGSLGKASLRFERPFVRYV